jgi:hypothetical protein
MRDLGQVVEHVHDANEIELLEGPAAPPPLFGPLSGTSQAGAA